MNKIAAFFLYLISLNLSAQTENRTLVWEENFDGQILDESVWNFELGNGCPSVCGWGNNEPQIYTKDNHVVANGFLTITARYENGQYTSTRITTRDKKEFQYGYIEARLKLPDGQGIWPAFWMLGAQIAQLGWPKVGEIDIMEYVGKEPGRIYHSLHTQSSHGNTVNNAKVNINGIEEDFHTYGVEWTTGAITFFIDSKPTYTYAPTDKNPDNWPFDKPFYILVNMAIGGNFGGPEIDNNIFPQQYLIDYIRVYQ